MNWSTLLKRPGRALLLGSLFTAVSFSTGTAHAVPALGDYDADGRSDLSVALVDRTAGTTSWTVRRTSGLGSLLYSWNVAADAFVTGKYYRGFDAAYPGVIRVPGNNKPFEWFIKNPFGGENTFSFGLPGDSIPNQADVDCDGVTDIFVTRSGVPGFFDGGKLWYFALSSKPNEIVQLLYGIPADRAGAADINGDGCAELVLLRTPSYEWLTRPLFSPGEVFQTVQWGLPGDIALLPQDFNFDGQADYVISRQDKVSGVQHIYIRMSNGNPVVYPIGLNSSIPMIGNFTLNNGPAWAERAIGLTAIRMPEGNDYIFPFGTPQNIIIRPDGTVVHPNVSPTGEPIQGPPATFVSSVVTTPPPSQSSGAPNCDIQIRKNDGSGGFKNNPQNSRRTLKIMLPSSYTDKVSEMTAWFNGQKFDTLYRATPNEWGNRMRFYGRKPLSSYPDNLLVVARLNSGQNACVTLSDPQRVQE